MELSRATAGTFDQRVLDLAGEDTMSAPRRHASTFDQRVLDLYDDYVHGRVDRRGFLAGAAQFAVAGTTAAGLLAALMPQYAFAAQVAADDPRIVWYPG